MDNTVNSPTNITDGYLRDPADTFHDFFKTSRCPRDPEIGKSIITQDEQTGEYYFKLDNTTQFKIDRELIDKSRGVFNKMKDDAVTNIEEKIMDIYAGVYPQLLDETTVRFERGNDVINYEMLLKELLTPDEMNAQEYGIGIIIDCGQVKRFEKMLEFPNKIYHNAMDKNIRTYNLIPVCANWDEATKTLKNSYHIDIIPHQGTHDVIIGGTNISFQLKSFQDYNKEFPVQGTAGKLPLDKLNINNVHIAFHNQKGHQFHTILPHVAMKNDVFNFSVTNMCPAVTTNKDDIDTTKYIMLHKLKNVVFVEPEQDKSLKDIKDLLNMSAADRKMLLFNVKRSMDSGQVELVNYLNTNRGKYGIFVHTGMDGNGKATFAQNKSLNILSTEFVQSLIDGQRSPTDIPKKLALEQEYISRAYTAIPEGNTTPLAMIPRIDKYVLYTCDRLCYLKAKLMNVPAVYFFQDKLKVYKGVSKTNAEIFAETLLKYREDVTQVIPSVANMTPETQRQLEVFREQAYNKIENTAAIFANNIEANRNVSENILSAWNIRITSLRTYAENDKSGSTFAEAKKEVIGSLEKVYGDFLNTLNIVIATLFNALENYFNPSDYTNSTAYLRKLGLTEEIYSAVQKVYNKAGLGADTYMSDNMTMKEKIDNIIVTFGLSDKKQTMRAQSSSQSLSTIDDGGVMRYLRTMMNNVASYVKNRFPIYLSDPSKDLEYKRDVYVSEENTNNDVKTIIENASSLRKLQQYHDILFFRRAAEPTTFTAEDTYLKSLATPEASNNDDLVFKPPYATKGKQVITVNVLDTFTPAIVHVCKQLDIDIESILELCVRIFKTPLGKNEIAALDPSYTKNVKWAIDLLEVIDICFKKVRVPSGQEASIIATMRQCANLFNTTALFFMNDLNNMTSYISETLLGVSSPQKPSLEGGGSSSPQIYLTPEQTANYLLSDISPPTGPPIRIPLFMGNSQRAMDVVEDVNHSLSLFRSVFADRITPEGYQAIIDAINNNFEMAINNYETEKNAMQSSYAALHWELPDLYAYYLRYTVVYSFLKYPSVDALISGLYEKMKQQTWNNAKYNVPYPREAKRAKQDDANAPTQLFEDTNGDDNDTTMWIGGEKRKRTSGEYQGPSDIINPEIKEVVAQWLLETLRGSPDKSDAENVDKSMFQQIEGSLLFDTLCLGVHIHKEMVHMPEEGEASSFGGGGVSKTNVKNKLSVMTLKDYFDKYFPVYSRLYY